MINIFVDSTGKISLAFADFTGAAIDPSTISLVITDPLGATTTKTGTYPPLVGDFSRTEAGHYYLEYDTSSTATPGTWLITCKASVGGLDEVSETIMRLLAPGSLWSEASDIIAEAGTPSFGNLGFSSAAAMQAHIENFILPGAQNSINQYLRREYTGLDVPDAVRYCVIRVAARGLMNIAINKKGGLRTVNEWMQALLDPTVFTPELKTEISSFILTRTGSIASSSYKTHDMKRQWGEE
jgi:hypothetical protein